jgi:hypothetical protein
MYIGSKYVQAELLRKAAARAGVHIYSENGDNLYADGNFAVIHARTAGEKSLHFPKAVSPYEVFENRSYGENVQEIEFKMTFGETKVFCLKGRL